MAGEGQGGPGKKRKSKSDPPPPDPNPQAYGLWTNKGGVGKTTLTFHTATTTAKLFPNKKVVALDCDAQANLSCAMLSGLDIEASKEAEDPDNDKNEDKKGERVLSDLEQQNFSDPEFQEAQPNLAGYTLLYVNGNKARSFRQNAANLSELVQQPKALNEFSLLPENLYLIPGSERLDLIERRLNQHLDTQRLFNQPSQYENTHLLINDLCQAVSDYVFPNDEVIFFIDCPPQFNLMTRLALCAMDELIAPLNADQFSKQAIKKLFHRVYGIHPDTNVEWRKLERDDFPSLMREFSDRLSVPMVNSIVNNMSEITRTRSSGAFFNIQKEQSLSMYESYEAACDDTSGSALFQVFIHPGTSVDNPEHFNARYTVTVRNMKAAGAASTYFGLPLWMLKNHRVQRSIKRYFDTNSLNPKGTVDASLDDLVYGTKHTSGFFGNTHSLLRLLFHFIDVETWRRVLDHFKGSSSFPKHQRVAIG